jgi:flavin-dependent dehydrogenase
MARAGFQVLIVEKETEFRDRVRGEVLLPWGSVEAKMLRIYDRLRQSCAREIRREIFSFGGEMSEPRDYPASTPGGTCALSFFIPRCKSSCSAAQLQTAPMSGAELH